MRVYHLQPEGLSPEQKERLDELTSESMDLFFKLEDAGLEDADLVLLRGVEIHETT
jgi:hypothetical protein